MKWPKVALDTVCEINVGRTPSRKEKSYWDEADHQWVSIADMSRERHIKTTKEGFSEKARVECNMKPVPAGTVLFSFKLSIGKVSICTKDMFTNEAIAALPVLNPLKLDAGYLARALEDLSFEGAGRRAVMGKTLNKEGLRKIKIPLPPLPEQQRIAAILDQADALRRLRREVRFRLDDLRYALFYEMFGDPAINPKGFLLNPLHSIAIKFSDGPFGSNLKSSHYVDEGVRVIRLQNIGVGQFVDDDQAYISESHFNELRKHECVPGDIVVGTLGNPNLRACIQPQWLDRALNKADCVQIRVNSKVATREYVCTLLNIPSVEKLARSLVFGQTRARISMGRLRDLKVPIAPKALQDQFSTAMLQLQSRVGAANKAIVASDALFASLQHRAFRGEL